jgi:hypothetical protein
VHDVTLFLRFIHQFHFTVSCLLRELTISQLATRSDTAVWEMTARKMRVEISGDE